MLEVQNLTLWRGTSCLFEHLSFLVPAGTALIVRGPNGSGKTTLLRVLAGLTRPEEGTVSWQGRPSADLKGRMEFVGHHPALKPELTVRQNLMFYARIGATKHDFADDLSELQITHCEDLEVRFLSAGQKRRVALVRALMSAAPLWLLDEPFTNLDAQGRGVMERRIAAHVSAGGLAVVVMHEDLQLMNCNIELLHLGRS